MHKAIVMDMDGTLLNSSNEISERTRKKLLELQEKGVRLILASGRSYTRLMPYARQLKMEDHQGILLEVDGIATYDLETMERQKRREMSPEEIRDIFHFLQKRYAESQACFDDGMFCYYPDSVIPLKEKLRKEQNVPEDYPWTAGPWNWLSDMQDGYPHIRYIRDANEIDRNINKIQIMTDPDLIQHLYEMLQDVSKGKFEIFRTTPRQLEILPQGYSKGKTLERLMEENGWTRDDVLVFGDGENDVSMFDVVTDSYAMENAQDFVKARAAHVCPGNNEDGIARTLEELGY